MTLNITHLFPDLLNLYGDRGNIASLCKRLQWRGIDANVNVAEKTEDINFEETDILFLGGGADREQIVVCEELLKIKEEIKSYVESDGVMIALCGGFQILGKTFQLKKDKLEGLGIIDAETKASYDRIMGNVIIKCDIDGNEFEVVGFENHSAKTYINENSPLGEVLFGGGNNGEDKTEGILYKNLFGSSLHGPLLPKNPELSDIILSRALKKKYPEFEGFDKLNDTLENTAVKNVKEIMMK